MQKDSSAKTKEPQKVKGRKNTPEPPPPPPPPPRRSKKKIFLVSLLLFLLAVVGAFAILFLLPSNEEKPAIYPAEVFEHLTMDDALLAFTWQYLPESYQALRGLNAELRLIKEEILRIEAIATRFPEQRRIPQTEIREWESLKREVETTITRIQSALQALYVTHLVNAAKGEEAIRLEAATLASELRTTHTLSREKTLRLSADPFETQPGRLDRLFQWLPWNPS
ncbi:hypothetical protein [Desulfobotulus sp.]|uniref:hypothetical protein n=1 Tax=Desulfobotulus sp. TaxID=1940337 RepID=UPI002A367CF1|nr:hypothetical protein [Desulfobotulus sp.]MDY0162865.1 hypothetical protein [Desulfobotulus sp.]